MLLVCCHLGSSHTLPFPPHQSSVSVFVNVSFGIVDNLFLFRCCLGMMLRNLWKCRVYFVIKLYLLAILSSQGLKIQSFLLHLVFNTLSEPWIDRVTCQWYVSFGALPMYCRQQHWECRATPDSELQKKAHLSRKTIEAKRINALLGVVVFLFWLQEYITYTTTLHIFS